MPVVNAIIHCPAHYPARDVLVLDNKGPDGKISTILPGGEIIEGENSSDAIDRILKNTLGILESHIFPELIYTDNQFLTEIELYKFLLLENISFPEIHNPRYMSAEKIVTLDTTADLTRKIIETILK